MRRRAVLASIATLPAAAGCLGGAPDDDSGGTADADGGNGGSGGAGAALEQLSGQPYIGEPPADADQLIVAFEDPGCPSCASFHRNRLPSLESELLDDGEATLVWRPLRYVSQVAPWNTQAMHAVLEIASRSNDAAWALLEFYYAHQDDLESGSVAEDTSAFVADETAVDADAVVEAMEAESHTDAIAASESAAEDAGVASTPTFLLFSGEEHVTTITGGATAAEFAAAFDA